MPRYKSGGRLRTSPTPPSLFTQKRSVSTETKYYGLRRDSALGDLTSSEKALNEVLTDIQDPSEALTLGKFVAADLQVIDGAVNYDLKKEDFEVLRDASINLEDANGSLLPLVNPRQRIADRIKQFEGFAGRGTEYQGQGTVLFKYYVPTDLPEGAVSKYSHTNLPPFFTEPIGSTVENAPDFIPTTDAEIASTHRLGYVKNGVFIPFQDPEWWWNGEYNRDFRERAEYGGAGSSALTDPKFPIVRDGNIRFENITPSGINTKYNWGLRFDAWWKRGFAASSNFMRWAAQVNGHLRIDYFEKTGYINGVVQGSWKTALNTADSSTYYSQVSKESPTSTTLGYRKYFLQGGPSMPVGTGTGTLPTQRSATNGGALDLNITYADKEGLPVANFDGDYVPVIIRFWYGQPSTNPAETNILTSAPLGAAGFAIDMIDSDVSSVALPRWNDYSSQLKLTYVASANAWSVDTSVGGTPVAEQNFVNYMNTFEVLAMSTIGPDSVKPANVDAYNYIPGLVVAQKDPIGGTTYARFTLPGVTPADGNRIWVIARNRPASQLPDLAYLLREELWQGYLFYPSPTSEYTNSNDLLDGVGQAYTEPNPAKTSFQNNTFFYKAKINQVPEPGTYGPARYDGTIVNTITESVGARDYDYSHDKLLFIGRQRKSEAVRPLAVGETRAPGENYTFIEVLENQAGFGGNVIINAYPTNNLGVLTTSITNAKLGKFLHMADNSKTYTNPSRQNISVADPSLVPTAAEFTANARILYEEIAGQGRLSIGTWNGTIFTYDNTGIIAKLTLGNGASRSHLVKSAFLTEVIKPSGGGTFSFFGFIGALRPSADNVSVTVVEDGANRRITSESLFPNNGDTANNNKYIGTEIIFDGDNIPKYVTSYDASTQTVTFLPADKAAGTYANTDVWYNYFSIGGVLPSAMVNSTGARVTRTSVIPNPSPTNIASRLVQLSVVYNTAYQFSRADNGAGLSFGETLYIKQQSAATPSVPFELDSELPSPPADIVIPFGYDNTQGSSEPGLGGLCYPPYSIQNIAFQELATTDVNLYSQPEGYFDMWWGGRNTSLNNLGNVSLTITDKLLFDFTNSDRGALLQSLLPAQKPALNATQYTHKLEVELGVGLPTPPTENPNLYNDVKVYSNNKPVKDKYYLFVNVGANNSVELLTANDPGWT